MPADTHTIPYGLWPSRIGPQSVAEGLRLADVAWDSDGETLVWLEGRSDRGVLVCLPPGDDAPRDLLRTILWDLAQSQYLADSSNLAETIQANLNALLRIESRGVKQAPFRVLMGATMPAVLVEIGFITNPEEEERLKQSAYRERIAQAIVDSVAAFKERSEKQLGIR